MENSKCYNAGTTKDKTGFVVGQFNSVIEIYSRPTLVAMVTKICKF